MICRKTEIVVREGWLFLSFVLALFILMLFIGYNFAAFFFIILFVCGIFIYRNPERIPYEFDDLSILSPIDGKVSFIGKVFEDRYLKKQMLLVSIDVSLCDVSLQRNPVDFEVVQTKLTHGLMLNSKYNIAKDINTRYDLLGKSDRGDILLTSIVGNFSSKIYTFCDNFKKVRKGDRYLFFTKGKVDLYLPLNCRLKITNGEKIIGGESVLGYFVDAKE